MVSVGRWAVRPSIGFGHPGNVAVDRVDRLGGAVGERRGEVADGASIAWIACAAPSVSVDVIAPSRLSMVSVTEMSKFCSSDLILP